MAKLLIYRGDVLEREVDLDERTASIGRDEKNDIVLADTGKSVSRVHAELRCEQGKYSVTDRNSQNGIWVAGRRVTNTELEPGVPVLLGSFKLVLKADRPPAPTSSDKTVLLPRADPANEATLLIAKPAAGSARPASNVNVAKTELPVAPENARGGTGSSPPAPAPLKPASSTASPVAEAAGGAGFSPPSPGRLKPAPPTAPPPVQTKVPEPPPPAKSAAKAKPARSSVSKRLLVSALAAGLVAVVAAALYVTSLRRQPARLTSSDSTPQPGGGSQAGQKDDGQATRQSGAGGTTPAGTTSGGDAGAVKTEPPRAGATATPDAAAGAAVTPDATKATAAAATTADATPTRSTTAGRAASTGEAGGGAQRKSASPPVTPPKPVANTPKTPDLASTFREARLELMNVNADYLKAIGLLEAVVKVDQNFVDGNYPSAATLLREAQSGARRESQRAVDNGEKAEMNRDYAAARKQYERAQRLDPQSTRPRDAMRRLELEMLREGEAAFKAAEQAYGSSQGSKSALSSAITGYERALELLPPDHEKVKVAQERLKLLKGG